MSDHVKPETISLFALWKEHRGELRPLGRLCEMARAGEIPGTVWAAGDRTPEILASEIDGALSVMRRSVA